MMQIKNVLAMTCLGSVLAGGAMAAIAPDSDNYTYPYDGADGFHMHVYSSKRDFVAPDWYYENSRKNATSASLFLQQGNRP